LKKKILFIYYKLNRPGGIARVLTNLVNELVEFYDITILILIEDKTTFYPLDERVKIVSVNSYAHPAFTIGCVGINKYFSWIPKKQNIKGYLYDFGAYWVLNKWLKSNYKNYDTIVTCMYKLSIGVSAKSKFAVKTIAWEHTDYHVGGVVFNNLRKIYFKKAKNIVAINLPSYRFYKTLNLNTHLIYNVVGSPFEEAEFKDSKQNRIIFVGRLDKEKNVKDILDIFEFSKLPQDWRLDIIGEGSEKKNLENQVKNYTKKSQINFHGALQIDQIINFYQNSKIFAFTSIKEALPTTLIEAMMCGNALLTYDCNYGPSDIINEKNGFLIPLHNKKMFIEKLEYLTHNPEALSELMKSSYKESKKWKKDKAIEQWKEIL